MCSFLEESLQNAELLPTMLYAEWLKEPKKLNLEKRRQGGHLLTFQDEFYVLTSTRPREDEFGADNRTPHSNRFQ